MVGLPGAGLHSAAPARLQRASLPRPLRAADAHPRLLLPPAHYRPALRLHRLRRRLHPNLRCASSSATHTNASRLNWCMLWCLHLAGVSCMTCCNAFGSHPPFHHCKGTENIKVEMGFLSFSRSAAHSLRSLWTLPFTLPPVTFSG